MYKPITIRISKSYNILCDFIIFINKNKERKEKKIIDSVINEGLDILVKNKKCNNSDNIQIMRKYYDREPKGFLIEENTMNRLKRQYEKYKLLYREKHDITINLGIFYEMIIYIWCVNNFTEEDFKYIDNNYIKNEWGFKIKNA